MNATVYPIPSRTEAELASEWQRATIFADFLDRLSAPTPAQQWLERAAAQLSAEREPQRQEKKTRAAKLVARVRERDGGACWYCRAPCGDDATLEHLNPLALGGSWELENLALAHQRCNRAVGSLPLHAKEAARAAIQQGELRKRGERK